MTNYDPNFSRNRMGYGVDPNVVAPRSNVGLIFVIGMVVVFAIVGFVGFEHDNGSVTNNSASTSVPADPTTGRSVAPAPVPSVNTATPAD